MPIVLEPEITPAGCDVELVIIVDIELLSVMELSIVVLAAPAPPPVFAARELTIEV